MRPDVLTRGNLLARGPAQPPRPCEEAGRPAIERLRATRASARQLEDAEAEVLVAGHRRLRVVAREALREDELLIGGQGFAPPVEREVQGSGFAARPQPVASTRSEKLALDAV